MGPQSGDSVSDTPNGYVLQIRQDWQYILNTIGCMLTQAGIPKMRQWLAVRPSVKQYDRLFMRPVAAVIADAVPLPDLDL